MVRGWRHERAALPVVRVKNKFGFAREELRGGYRDLMLSVLYEDPESRLRIIGEIQARGGRVCACVRVRARVCVFVCVLACLFAG